MEDKTTKVESSTWDSTGEDTEPERCRWRASERSVLGGLVSRRCMRGRGHPGECCFRESEARKMEREQAHLSDVLDPRD
jgi:hypothetical protein